MAADWVNHSAASHCQFCKLQVLTVSYRWQQKKKHKKINNSSVRQKNVNAKFLKLNKEITCTALAWTDSRHFGIGFPAKYRLWNDCSNPILMTDLVVLLIGWSKFPSRSTNQNHYPDLGSETFLQSFLRSYFAQGNQWWRREMSAVFSGWHGPAFTLHFQWLMQNPDTSSETPSVLFANRPLLCMASI